jgi:hypothetical protein
LTAGGISLSAGGALAHAAEPVARILQRVTVGASPASRIAAVRVLLARWVAIGPFNFLVVGVVLLTACLAVGSLGLRERCGAQLTSCWRRLALYRFPRVAAGCLVLIRGFGGVGGVRSGTCVHAALIASLLLRIAALGRLLRLLRLASHCSRITLLLLLLSVVHDQVSTAYALSTYSMVTE